MMQPFNTAIFPRHLLRSAGCVPGHWAPDSEWDLGLILRLGAGSLQFRKEQASVGRCNLEMLIT